MGGALSAETLIRTESNKLARMGAAELATRGGEQAESTQAPNYRKIPKHPQEAADPMYSDLTKQARGGAKFGAFDRARIWELAPHMVRR